MIKKINKDECNRLRDNVRNRNDLIIKGYKVEAINTIDMYGVSVNEFVSLINSDNNCYVIKAIMKSVFLKIWKRD